MIQQHVTSCGTMLPFYIAVSIASNATENPPPFRGFLLVGRSAVDDSTQGGTFLLTDPRSSLSSCQPRGEVMF